MEQEITEISYGLFAWQAFVILNFGLMVYSIIDILRNSFEQKNKLIWILVVLFLPIMGPIL